MQERGVTVRLLPTPMHTRSEATRKSPQMRLTGSRVPARALGGVFVIAVCFSFVASWARASVQRAPDLSAFSVSDQRQMEATCSWKRSAYGPAAFYECLKEQAAQLRHSRSAPDLSAFSVSHQRQMEVTCSWKRSAYGPAAFYECLKEQAEQLRAYSGSRDPKNSRAHDFAATSSSRSPGRASPNAAPADGDSSSSPASTNEPDASTVAGPAAFSAQPPSGMRLFPPVKHEPIDWSRPSPTASIPGGPGSKRTSTVLPGRNFEATVPSHQVQGNGQATGMRLFPRRPEKVEPPDWSRPGPTASILAGPGPNRTSTVPPNRNFAATVPSHRVQGNG